MSAGLVEQFSGVIGVSKKLRPAGAFLGNFTVVFLYKHLLLRGLPDRRRFHLAYSTWFQPDFHHLLYQKTIDWEGLDQQRIAEIQRALPGPIRARARRFRYFSVGQGTRKAALYAALFS